jgi:hypothetical protein
MNPLSIIAVLLFGVFSLAPAYSSTDSCIGDDCWQIGTGSGFSYTKNDCLRELTSVLPPNEAEEMCGSSIRRTCIDNANNWGMNITDALELCKAAQTDHPLRCFLSTQSSLSTMQGIDLCKDAISIENAKCYFEAARHTPDKNTAVELCRHANSVAPAKCFDRLRGQYAGPTADIVSACKFSLSGHNADCFLQTGDYFIDPSYRIALCQLAETEWPSACVAAVSGLELDADQLINLCAGASSPWRSRCLLQTRQSMAYSISTEESIKLCQLADSRWPSDCFEGLRDGSFGLAVVNANDLAIRLCRKAQSKYPKACYRAVDILNEKSALEDVFLNDEQCVELCMEADSMLPYTCYVNASKGKFLTNEAVIELCARAKGATFDCFLRKTGRHEESGDDDIIYSDADAIDLCKEPL